MKILNFIFQFLLSGFILAILIYWITAYDSAFEADRICHSYLSDYSVASNNYECDHDTETHKWILFKDLDGPKAEIIKKFRYKFL